MCGIIGLIKPRIEEFPTDVWQVAQQMQAHRGPDARDSQRFHINDWQVHLAHQRLAIIDLSEQGKQPMISTDGSSVIIFNGELYNYIELKNELLCQGIAFKTNTDTEVIIEALRKWGPKKAIKRFNGMWSFAWLDIGSNIIWLSRDRTGEKPLYYHIDENHSFYFASELKTLLQIAGKKFSLNYQIIGEYLIPSLIDTNQETFFEDIYHLPAGRLMKVDLTQGRLNTKTYSYWKCPDFIHEPATDFKHIQEKIKDKFIRSVELRLRSDVSIGVLLSGGLDSSSIAAVTNDLVGKDGELTFLSAVSSDKKYDESYFIDIVAKHLNRPVTKVNLKVEPSNAIQLLEIVNWYNDAPVSSFSTVAHYLLMQKARENGIKVILSGQGADELLCGYRKYLGFYLQHLFRNKKFLNFTKTAFDFYRNKTIISQFNLAEAKRYLPSLITGNDVDIRGPVLLDYRTISLGMNNMTCIQERQLLDLLKYSVPALNHYEDRMSMANSREIRLPFLDVDLIELLLPLPAQYKLCNGWTKYCFRYAMEDYLPQEIIWRKDKQGFVNPQSVWLKYDLKETVLSYFSEDALMFKLGIVNRKALLKKYSLYCNSDSRNIWYRDIFSPLSLEVWLRNFEKFITF